MGGEKKIANSDQRMPEKITSIRGCSGNASVGGGGCECSAAATNESSIDSANEL